MEEQRRRRRNLAQNIVITLLSLSAVILFAQTQVISLNLPSAQTAARWGRTSPPRCGWPSPGTTAAMAARP